MFTQRTMATWWGKVLVGAVLAAGGFLVFHQLSRLESGAPGTVRVNVLIKLAYELGGKWVATVLMWLAGLAMIAWGFVQRARDRA